MTFRTALTSATAVDTGAGKPAGVRIYQSRDGKGNPMGVIEFDDGVTGDTPATITIGSFGNLGGGALTIKGGSYGGIAAPSLMLQVDQAGQSSAQLTSPLTVVQSAAPVMRSGILNYSTAHSDPTYQDAVVMQLADGGIVLEGLVSNQTGASVGSTDYPFLTLPAWAIPAKRIPFTVWSNAGPVRVDVVPADGQLHLESAVVNGGWFSLADITYRP